VFNVVFYFPKSARPAPEKELKSLTQPSPKERELSINHPLEELYYFV